MTDEIPYTTLLAEIKQRIQTARSRAALAVNSELIRLYWEIGRTLLQRRDSEGWGSRVVDRLASDLKEAFPTMKGFSSRNLKYMRTFAQGCPDLRIGQQPAAQLPWFHLVTLLTKVDREDEREWLCSRAVPALAPPGHINPGHSPRPSAGAFPRGGTSARWPGRPRRGACAGNGPGGGGGCGGWRGRSGPCSGR